MKRAYYIQEVGLGKLEFEAHSTTEYVCESYTSYSIRELLSSYLNEDGHDLEFLDGTRLFLVREADGESPVDAIKFEELVYLLDCSVRFSSTPIPVKDACGNDGYLKFIFYLPMARDFKCGVSIGDEACKMAYLKKLESVMQKLNQLIAVSSEPIPVFSSDNTKNRLFSINYLQFSKIVRVHTVSVDNFSMAHYDLSDVEIQWPLGFSDLVGEFYEAVKNVRETNA